MSEIETIKCYNIILYLLRLLFICAKARSTQIYSAIANNNVYGHIIYFSFENKEIQENSAFKTLNKSRRGPDDLMLIVDTNDAPIWS